MEVGGEVGVSGGGDEAEVGEVRWNGTADGVSDSGGGGPIERREEFVGEEPGVGVAGNAGEGPGEIETGAFAAGEFGVGAAEEKRIGESDQREKAEGAIERERNEVDGCGALFIYRWRSGEDEARGR